MFFDFFPLLVKMIPIGVIESFNLAFLDSVFRNLHETVNFLNVDVLDVIASRFRCILNNFGRHEYILKIVVCTKI